MPVVTLPDGNSMRFDTDCSGRTVAEAIGPGLAKKAIGYKVADEIRDLDRAITEDCSITIITAKDDDPDAQFLLRHSAAHVLAEAVCDLIPGTKLAYGPPVDGGFYYDMATPRPVTTDDFPAIEKRMQEIVKEKRPFTRCEFSHQDGLARVGDDKYKKDNAERAIERGSDTLSFYVTGEQDKNWEDLCAGPHVPHTGFLANAKVMSVAGAYWHGDHTSDQLTRIYGTCFADKKSLKKHLQMLEEAKKRDHRRIGREMQLFHIDEDNPGQIYWHPNGLSVYRSIQDFIRQKISRLGYVEVSTPTLQPQGLWERSGHWDKYRENMFITFEQDRGGMDKGEKASNDPEMIAAGAGGNRCFSLKPMNCPGHIEIFKKQLRSYRDLPMRIAEFGECTRYEPSGALHGIMRARSFVQDDGHIFCTEDQVGDEVADFCNLLKEVYGDFGFDVDSVKVKFATRPEVRVGSDEDWDRSEEALQKATEQANLTTELHPGEGAFYGPKLEFTLVDCLGREWQCGTIQVDYLLAAEDRLDVTYVAEDGSRKRPIILHRAICGSLERFFGILIEHYAGKFPLWLAPEQIRVLTVTDDQIPYAREVVADLQAAGLRATLSTASEKLGAKIRDARNDRVNYFAVIGGQEVDNKTVSLQKQNGDKLGSRSIADLVAELKEEISSHA